MPFWSHKILRGRTRSVCDKTAKFKNTFPSQIHNSFSTIHPTPIPLHVTANNLNKYCLLDKWMALTRFLPSFLPLSLSSFIPSWCPILNMLPSFNRQGNKSVIQEIEAQTEWGKNKWGIYSFYWFFNHTKKVRVSFFFFFNLALELCIIKRGTYILSLSEHLAYLFSRVRKTNIYWI